MPRTASTGNRLHQVNYPSPEKLMMHDDAKDIIAYLRDATVSGEELFATLIGSVEIEISSACNRRCAYCPQSVVARHQELMPIALFRKIVGELHRIDYRKDISFHQFNEPLLVTDHLYVCMREVREKLPGASMNIFTNGDKLTRDVLEELAALGAGTVMATCQYAEGEEWSVKSAVRKIRELCDRLGAPCDIRPQGASLMSLATLGGTELWIMSSDLMRHGSHRLGTVPVDRRERTHAGPCKMMLGSMNISYSGTAYLCCEFCHGVPEQQRYALGSAYDLTVFELLQRKKNFIIPYLSGNPPACCRNCGGN